MTTSPASAGTSSASCQVCRALAGWTRDSAFGLGREDPIAAEVISDAPFAAQVSAWPSPRHREW